MKLVFTLLGIIGTLGTAIYLGSISPEERLNQCLDDAFATVCERTNGHVEEYACVGNTATSSYNTKLAGEYLERLRNVCYEQSTILNPFGE